MRLLDHGRLNVNELKYQCKNVFGCFTRTRLLINKHRLFIQILGFWIDRLSLQIRSIVNMYTALKWNIYIFIPYSEPKQQKLPRTKSMKNISWVQWNEKHKKEQNSDETITKWNLKLTKNKI